MEDSVAAGKKSRVLLRNLIAGAIGLIPSIALLMMVLRVQSFLPSAFVCLVVFACPVPIALGLFVGFVSPQKAVAWAPLWAAILAILLFIVISGNLQDASPFSPAEVACILAGGMIAAAAGWVGRWAARQGRIGVLVGALLIACCAMVGAGAPVMRAEMHAYQRNVQPHVLSQVDQEYIGLHSVVGWQCERLIDQRCYLLSSVVHGRPIRVIAEAAGPALVCVEYSCIGKGPTPRTTGAAKARLAELGVRRSLLQGLSEQKGAPGNWSSVHQTTRLTFTGDGRLTLTGIPLHGISRETPP